MANIRSLQDLLRPQEEEEAMMSLPPQELSPEVEPEQLFTPNVPISQENFMPQALQEAADVGDNLSPPTVPDVMPDISQAPPLVATKPPMVPDAPQAETDLQRLEKRLQELRDLDTKRAQDAESRNFNANMIASIGEGLGKYTTAGIQKNVGTQLKHQGVTSKEIMDMVGKPKIPTSKEQREQMLAQYRDAQAAQLTKDRDETKYGREDKLLDKKYKYDLDVARAKASQKSEGMGFREKEEIKAEIKENLQVGKEDRSTREGIEKALPLVDDQIKNVETAINLLDKSGFIGGTGLIDQYMSKSSPEGQLLEKALKNISLDTLVQKFQGMSKAVDTEADRQFFEATQPNMSNFEGTNKQMLTDILARLKGIKSRSNNKLTEINERGSTSQKEQPVDDFERRVQASMKKNPSYSREEIIAALKK
jgi:hypothetical protein